MLPDKFSDAQTLTVVVDIANLPEEYATIFEKYKEKAISSLDENFKNREIKEFVGDELYSDPVVLSGLDATGFIKEVVDASFKQLPASPKLPIALFDPDTTNHCLELIASLKHTRNGRYDDKYITPAQMFSAYDKFDYLVDFNKEHYEKTLNSLAEITSNLRKEGASSGKIDKARERILLQSEIDLSIKNNFKFELDISHPTLSLNGFDGDLSFIDRKTWKIDLTKIQTDSARDNFTKLFKFMIVKDLNNSVVFDCDDSDLIQSDTYKR